MKGMEPDISQLEKRYILSFLPTPFHPLKNLSKKFPGYQLFIKRDDHTGLAMGGNKARKLEYFIYDALHKKCGTVITGGAQQSNHCRQTAAACAAAGLECHLVLGGNEPEVYEGNLLLSHLFGAVLHFTGEHRKGEDIPALQSELVRKNKRCYAIPYGGSNETGALGYVNALREFKSQLEERSTDIDYIFFASSSGGTYAGLAVGLKLFKLNARLMPVNIDKELILGLQPEENIVSIMNNTAGLLKMEREFSLDDIQLIRGYDEAGYGVVTENEKAAIRQLAQSEGILLDPVYTGRAFYGMMEYLGKGKIKPNSNVLFWHTGGLPANFYYGEELR